jgi:hypothetical protein
LPESSRPGYEGLRTRISELNIHYLYSLRISNNFPGTIAGKDGPLRKGFVSSLRIGQDTAPSFRTQGLENNEQLRQQREGRHHRHQHGQKRKHAEIDRGYEI